jgi:hypothetical protein
VKKESESAGFSTSRGVYDTEKSSKMISNLKGKEDVPVTYLYPASATQYPANITSAVPRPGSGFREHPVIKWCFLQAS